MVVNSSVPQLPELTVARAGGRDARPSADRTRRVAGPAHSPVRWRRLRMKAHFSLLTSHFASLAALVALGCAIVCTLATPAARADDFHVPSDHPRLLLTAEDAAIIRVRCGTQGPGDAPDVKARFGAQRDVLERLRDAAGAIMAGPARDDDLVAPAMMHLASGRPDQADEYTRYITEALLDPGRRIFELDALLALDWCWDAIDAETRTRICDRLPLAPEPFDDETSPVDHYTFSRRLRDLAGAIVSYQAPGSSPRRDERLARIIAAGQKYLEGPFVAFCRQRGAVPTSGEKGIWEEADYAFALELLRVGLGRNVWPEVADSFGRSMEHYLYADTEYAGLAHGFIHDDGSTIPARPATVFRGFGPAVPWVIARQTRDPVAVRYADRSLPRKGEIVPLADRYGWVRLVYGPISDPEVARRGCPLGRNFGGGWVAMRSSWDRGATVVLFDAGQPFWRSRQHFDAGQFQIYHQGRLTVPSGDDVTFEATAARRGTTSIGGELGDWDQYYQSTIAHNCITVTDRRRVQRLYGRLWPAIGNQRLIGHDYVPAEGELDKAGRQTGRLLAFETNAFYTYAAADLAPAYEREIVPVMRREILLLNAGAVLVFDRLAAVSDKSLKTWHLQLPSRPELVSTAQPEGPGTAAALKQTFGVDRDAGVWEVVGDNPAWLSTTEEEGRLFVRTLLPAKARQLVIGGPRRARQIPDGPFQGQTYYGGDARSFEYRLWPAAVEKGPTAAYELGRPTGLGPQFGVGANWGRLDVSSPENTEEVVFLHLLIPTNMPNAQPPPVRFQPAGNSATVELTLGTQQIRVTLAVVGPREGQVTIRDQADKLLIDKKLAAETQPTEPLPHD